MGGEHGLSGWTRGPSQPELVVQCSAYRVKCINNWPPHRCRPGSPKITLDHATPHKGSYTNQLETKMRHPTATCVHSTVTARPTNKKKKQKENQATIVTVCWYCTLQEFHWVWSMATGGYGSRCRLCPAWPFIRRVLWSLEAIPGLVTPLASGTSVAIHTALWINA